MDVAIGVDSHKQTLAAAAVNPLGRVLEVKEFAYSEAGHLEFTTWAKGMGRAVRIGIEGSGSYGASAGSPFARSRRRRL
jgi:transposase